MGGFMRTNKFMFGIVVLALVTALVHCGSRASSDSPPTISITCGGSACVK